MAPSAPRRSSSSTSWRAVSASTALDRHDDAYFALTELVGPQLAALTEAPGAPPLPEGNDQHRLDQAMASIGQLRMRGKLDHLLPQPPEPSPASVAHRGEPAAPLHAGVMLLDAANGYGPRTPFSELSAD